MPAPENALALFPGRWASSLPDRDGPGAAPLFDDDRIKWLIAELGGVDGYEVLELGPLEGAHTFMLEKSGANVCAIEGNEDAFLRCLIVKNHFDLRARFLLGDFAASFGRSGRWDLVVASGVLYHMSDPVGLLRNMAQVSDRVFVWTHYFEPDGALWSHSIRERIGDKWLPEKIAQVEIAGLTIRGVPQRYLESLQAQGFCGGPESSSLWLFKDDILALLRALGFDDLRIAFDEPAHPHGPSFAVLAQRTSTA